MAVEASGDHSLPALIAANVAALLVALATGMGLFELMMVYWIQSVIIGIANFVRIVRLKQFEPGPKLTETVANKWATGIFFLIHYGAFHLFYFIFLNRAFERDSDADPSAMGYLLCALLFAANHGYALLQNLRRDALGRPRIGNLVVLPYARVVPMHVTIVSGGLFLDEPYAFQLFVSLKIAADVVMHVVEQRVLRQGR